MKSCASKRWLLPLAAGFMLATSAPAETWYSSYNPSSPLLRTESRVTAIGDAFSDKVFNTFSIPCVKNLTFITFYGPVVVPMYWVELRWGGAGTTAAGFRHPANALVVRPDPIFGNKITICIPTLYLNPGTWSISVASDVRFSLLLAFYRPTFCPGWTVYVDPLNTLNPYSWRPSSGLMLQLSDTL